MAMVMNLDKCIGCHTCSVTCKQAWTNRSGGRVRLVQQRRDAPGQGYPRTYQDQERWKGGWQLSAAGCRCVPAVGSRSCFSIFSNPLMPSIDDYYEPWTYDYETLTDAPAQKHTPVARPKSLISGKDMKIQWSANWDDNLGGSPALTVDDPVLKQLGDKVKLEFEQTFMFYLPRICEHCLNPSCAASCPSGAIYKREEDGIVLVDQDKCRGWRMCVTGCPYKKIYFNHRTGKAEKCTFCFPRVEVGIPTVCAETCVGRLRYIGVVLYDADRVLAARPSRTSTSCSRRSARSCSTRTTPRCSARRRPRHPPGLGDRCAAQPGVGADQPLRGRAAAAPGVPHDADGLVHPAAVPGRRPAHRDRPRRRGRRSLFGAIDSLRIPIEYLAELFTAGDPKPVRDVLARLAAMRSFMRDINLVASRTCPSRTRRA
jgi:nitrate reductase beta subunit